MLLPTCHTQDKIGLPMPQGHVSLGGVGGGTGSSAVSFSNRVNCMGGGGKSRTGVWWELGVILGSFPYLHSLVSCAPAHCGGAGPAPVRIPNPACPPSPGPGRVAMCWQLRQSSHWPLAPVPSPLKPASTQQPQGTFHNEEDLTALPW